MSLENNTNNEHFAGHNKRDLRNVINWKITDRCNFGCEYCFSRGKKNIASVPRIDVEKFIRKIKKTGREWEINITGGEPFLYPGLIPLCERLSEEFTLGFDTNLSDGKKLRELLMKVPPGRIRFFNAAVHIEERERLGLKDDFIRNVLLLKEKGINVNVLYVYHPRLMSRYEDDEKMFLSKGIRIIPKMFYGKYQGKKYPLAYTKEDTAFMKLHDPEFQIRKMVFSYDVSCRTGRDVLFIDPKGDVYRCPADEEIMGNINKSFRINDSPEPCKRRICKCFSHYIVDSPENKIMLFFNTISERFNI